MPNGLTGKHNIFSGIGRTLTATSLGLQGKDPSDVFRDLDEESFNIHELKTKAELAELIQPGSGKAIIAQAIGMNNPSQQVSMLPNALGQQPASNLVSTGGTLTTDTLSGKRTDNFTDTAGEAQKTRSGEVAKINFKREMLRKDLDSFLTVDDNINRSEGGFFDRMVKGGKTVLSSLDQSTAEGAVAASHNALSKNLRVKLVRAAGDVGNLNIVEQKAAEQIIPGFFDSKKTAMIKRAALADFSAAVDSGDISQVKKVLSEFQNTEAYKPLEFKTEEEAEKAKLPKGTIIIIGGKRARVSEE